MHYLPAIDFPRTFAVLGWVLDVPLHLGNTALSLNGDQTIAHLTAVLLAHPASPETAANQVAAEADGYGYWPVAISIAAGLLALMAIWLFSRWIGRRGPRR